MTAGTARLATEPGSPARPLDGPGRWLRIAPFVAIAVVGLVLALSESAYPLPPVLAAGGVLVAIVAAVGVLPWRRWPADWQAVPALAFYLVSGLLGYASGQHTEFVFLTALPVIWLVLFHTRRLVILGLVLLAVTLFGPPLLVPEQRPEHWNDMIMAFLLTTFGGLAGHQLVSRHRAAAAEAAAATQHARADRDLLNAYLETAGCLVVVLDRAGRVTLFNRFCEQVTGYRAEDMIGQSLWRMGRDPGGGRRAYEEVLAGQGPVAYEGDWITSTGEHRRIAWTGTGLADHAGQITHVIGTGVDITEQRAAERLFANVLAAAPEQIIIATDVSGTFTVFNVGAERMLGYTADEVIGKHTVELIHVPEELAAVATAAGFGSVREMFESTPADMPPQTSEWTMVRKDGTRFPALMTVSPMYDGGTVVGYVNVARDITAEREAKAAMLDALERERQAAERLRELDQVKSEFVATASHDLRTPLTSIIGNTELLLDGDAGELGPMPRRLLEAVGRNARRLDTLVGDLLLLSRIESGTLRMHLRPVSVREIVDGALETLTNQRAADVHLEVTVPDQPVLVQGDPDQLERVVTNLLSNALKFTPPGGRVDISVDPDPDPDPDQVRLQVCDTGIGIPANELPHVFDRFFRSSRSQQRDRPGTGLGLTIAKSIVEQHGGTIQASANPSGGTTFTIRLPRLVALAGTTEKERA